MPKSTPSWLESQLAWQQREAASESASPRTRRFSPWRKRRERPSEPDSPGSGTQQAKSGTNQPQERSRPCTGRGG